MHAASPQNVSIAQNLGVLYNFRSVALNALGDRQGAMASLQQALGTCVALLNRRYDISCQHTVWMAHRRMAATLATMGDSRGALREAKISLDPVQRPESQHDAQIHAYLARALAGNGNVYMIFAKRAAGRERASDWRTTADFYRRATAEFQVFHPTTEPYLSEARQVEASLAECESALTAPAIADSQR
jgi:hypothetical protein